TLDVHGLMVCPGFIDPHTHTIGDLSSPKLNGNVSYLLQGVTTVGVGNDGGGSPQVAKTLDLWRRQGIGTNALLLVGHGAVRDEDSYSIGLLGAIAETIRIGREARIPVHISHIKALGPQAWGRSVAAIQMIEKARAEGVDVTADQYPYAASGSSLVASLLPAWAQAGKAEEVLARLDDSGVRPRLLEEMTQNLKRRGGADSLLFTSSDAPELLGKRLSE